MEVHNTDKRLSEAVAALDVILQSGKLSKKDALSLRGRLAFCDAFIFGRLGRVSLQNITHHAYSSPFIAELNDSMVQSLGILRDRMKTAKPRCLDLNLLNTFVLMTDAAFDPSKGAGLGAVLVSPTGSIVCWFGIQLSLKSLSSLLGKDRQTVIGEMETLAVAVSLMLWGPSVASSKLFDIYRQRGLTILAYQGIFNCTCHHSYLCPCIQCTR